MGGLEVVSGAEFSLYTEDLTVGGGLTGGGSVNVEGNTLTVDEASSHTFAGTIAGSGYLVKQGVGTMILSGSLEQTMGGVTVSDGTLRLGASDRLSDGGTLAIASGAIFDMNGYTEDIGALSVGGTLALGGGTLTFGDAADTTFSGSLTGTGRLYKEGTGTLTFTGTSAHSGYFFVDEGTMVLGGDNRFSANGTIAVQGGAVLDLDNHDLTLGGFSSTGITDIGTATLTLSGGKLVVNATLGAVTLVSGASLGGSGTVGALDAGGTVAPGNSIGTLSTGSVTFRNGSTYHVEINDAGAGDRVEVSGVATIEAGAAVEVDPEPGSYAANTSYTIVGTTGGVTGTFGAVAYTLGNTLFHDLSLEYRGNDVILWLARNAKTFSETVDPVLEDVGGAVDEVEDDTGGDDSSAAPVTRSPQWEMLQALYDLEGDALNRAVAQLSGAGAWPAGLWYRVGSAMVSAASGGVGALRWGGGTRSPGFTDMARLASGDSGGMAFLGDVGQALVAAESEGDRPLALDGEVGGPGRVPRGRLWFDTLGASASGTPMALFPAKVIPTGASRVAIGIPWTRTGKGGSPRPSRRPWRSPTMAWRGARARRSWAWGNCAGPRGPGPSRAEWGWPAMPSTATARLPFPASRRRPRARAPVGKASPPWMPATTGARPWA
jgi:autotransporter-associated beta strand protein